MATALAGVLVTPAPPSAYEWKDTDEEDCGCGGAGTCAWRCHEYVGDGLVSSLGYQAEPRGEVATMHSVQILPTDGRPFVRRGAASQLAAARHPSV